MKDKVDKEIGESFENGELPSDETIEGFMQNPAERNYKVSCEMCEITADSDELGRFDEAYYCDVRHG